MGKTTPVTRYGTRYGRTIRERLAAAEEGHRGKHKCPYCSYTQVSRVAKGIWNCDKCSSKFTSRAYQLREPVPIKTEVVGEENV